MIDGLLVALMEHVQGVNRMTGCNMAKLAPRKAGQMGNVGVTRRDSMTKLLAVFARMEPGRSESDSIVACEQPNGALTTPTSEPPFL